MDELEKLEYNDEFNAVYDAEVVQKKLENSARLEGESIGIKKGEKHKEREIVRSMLKKNFAYLCRVASSIYEKGENYEKERQVTLINMNNWTCEENKMEGVDHYNFHSTKYKKIIEGMESFEIYLGKYKGMVYNGSNKVEAGFSLLPHKVI